MEEKMKRKSLDMTQGEPIKLLTLFAIPMLIGSVFQLMYNMVDTVVVGRYVSIDALAAIGATSSSTMFIMFLGQSITNAVSVIISQAEGAKQEGVLKKAVTHAVYLTLAMGVFLGLAALVGARPLLTILRTPENIIDNSVTYIQITSGLTIAAMSYNGVSSILRAIGDSKTPLYFLIFSSLLNVGLDLLFVLALQWGVAGVGWATVISQAVSAVLCGAYMLRRHPRLRPDAGAWSFDPEIVKDYLRIGLPMCAQQMLLCSGMFVITAVINSFGSDIVAAHTIGGKVEQLATMLFSSFSFSFSVYSGQNFGAKKYDRIGAGLKKGLLVIVGMSLISTLIMMLFAEPLARLFMDANAANTEYVLQASVAMVRVEATFFSALGCIWALNSTLRGVGAVHFTLISSIVELASKIGFSIFLPILIPMIFPSVPAYIGIWLAAPIGWVLGLIPSLLYLIYWIKLPDDRKAPKRRKKAEPREETR